MACVDVDVDAVMLTVHGNRLHSNVAFMHGNAIGSLMTNQIQQLYLNQCVCASLNDMIVRSSISTSITLSVTVRAPLAIDLLIVCLQHLRLNVTHAQLGSLPDLKMYELWPCCCCCAVA